MNLYDHINSILDCSTEKVSRNCFEIGHSVESRLINGYKFGNGSKKISLIAGNHADEPIGSMLLRKLISYLSGLKENDHLLKTYTWWIVPHTNPDGEERNNRWFNENTSHADLYAYLQYVIRELPEEDLEFGYPIENQIDALRPENKAVYDFWKMAGGEFDLHASLHGMRSSYGPWFLIDQEWAERTKTLQSTCAVKTNELGYNLFDLDRRGEKGFYRIAEGFCTRPDSKEMRKHFEELDDHTTATKFHPSSMESVQSLGHQCLTLVTEMPLFIYPKKERDLAWPDIYLDEMNDQFLQWKIRIDQETLSKEELEREMDKQGFYPMPYDDQMRLQWQLIVAGLETI